MTDLRILKGIPDPAEGTPARRRREPRPGGCPRCGLSHIPARPSSVHLVEWTDADGYHADLELCPDPDCPVWLHGSGPREPLAGRMTRPPGARRWRRCWRPSTRRTPRFTTGPAIFSRIRTRTVEGGQKTNETRPAWQIDYRPVSLVRLRRLTGALVAGEQPAGATTLEWIKAVEG